MKKLLILLFSMFIVFFSSSIYADYKVIIIKPLSVPYDLSPNNYSNSPNNYSNSPNNYSNSPNNYSNSPNNYSNSPNNYSNGPSGLNRLVTKENYFVGYYVKKDNNMINFFNLNGERLGYLPAGNHTSSIFDSIKSKWCGTFGFSNGERVIGLVSNCYKFLLK